MTAAAWQTKPSWYLVADDDRMVSPELQRALAHKLGATTQSLASGHLPMLSQPGWGSCFYSRSGAANRVGSAVVRGANGWLQQKLMMATLLTPVGLLTFALPKDHYW